MRILITGGAGYIGSALSRYLTEIGHQVFIVDLGWRGVPPNSDIFFMDYKDLTYSQLNTYPVIIHLAGHSSVAAAKETPHAAFQNNVVSFSSLLKKLDGQRLIYASSASVYSEQNLNLYDFTKRTCDEMAEMLYPNRYALRFGTVCGPSPNIRTDLMINAMVNYGTMFGTIQVNNQNVYRPILGINDLCRSIEALIREDHLSGIYNLASFTSTVGEIAGQVAATGGWKIKYIQDSPTYDITMPVDTVVPMTDTVQSLTLELIEAYK